PGCDRPGAPIARRSPWRVLTIHPRGYHRAWPRCGLSPVPGRTIMSRDRPREPEAEASRAGARARNSRRLQTGVRGLIVVVACCGVITWAARTVWESQHPAIAAARGLGSPKPSDRARAARELMATGVNEPGLATLPLIAALGDPEAEVRAAAADALG